MCIYTAGRAALCFVLTLQHYITPTLCALTWTILAPPLSVPSSEWRIWWVEWEMELRPDSNYHNILFPCDVNIILNWKIGELKCFLYFPLISSDYTGVLETWNNGKEVPRLDLTSLAMLGQQIHKFDHTRTANQCDWLLCRRAVLPLVGCPHSLVW